MKAQKQRGREEILSARIVYLLVPVLIFLSSSLAQALENWDIYSDTDIIDGQYILINIYDTPPDHTTVNMYGGSADYIGTHDSSILNMYDGQTDVRALETSIINISGGTISLADTWQYGEINISGSSEVEAIVARDFGTVNISGGIMEVVGALNSGIVNLYAGTISDCICARDSSTISIFGHDLFMTNSGGKYGYGQVSGFWIYDIPFLIDLGNVEAYEHIYLIPEPTAFALFGIGFLILLRKKNFKNNIKHS